MTANDRGLRIEKPLIFLDLETTSADVDRAEIVEIAAIKVLPSSKTKIFEKRIRPSKPIPKEASDVHGITDEDVKNCPLFVAVAEEVQIFFAGCDVSGFNIQRFDIPILTKEFNRCGVNWDITGMAVIDSMRIFHMREPRDLSAAVAHYTDKFHVGAHSALSDAKAAMAVLLGQLEHYSDLPTTPWELYQEFRPANAVDLGEKLIRNETGDICWNFGKYKGESVYKNSSYVEWVIAKVPLGSDAHAILRDVLARKNTRVR